MDFQVVCISVINLKCDDTYVFWQTGFQCVICPHLSELPLTLSNGWPRYNIQFPFLRTQLKLPALLFLMPNLSWNCILGKGWEDMWEMCGHTKLLGFKVGGLTVWKHKLSSDERVEDHLNSEVRELAEFIPFRFAALMFIVFECHYFMSEGILAIMALWPGRGGKREIGLIWVTY